jgi:hypothetical protein
MKTNASITHLQDAELPGLLHAQMDSPVANLCGSAPTLPALDFLLGPDIMYSTTASLSQDQSQDPLHRLCGHRSLHLSYENRRLLDFAKNGSRSSSQSQL